MIQFMFFTATPTTVFNRLVERGWIDGTPTDWRSTIPTVNIQEVPNPVMQTAAVLDAQGNVVTPPVPYTQRAFAVQIAHDREADETDGSAQTDAEGNPLPRLDRTKIGAWIKNNSTAVTITGYLGNSQTPINFPARKWNSVQLWVLHSNLVEQYIHTWQ